ncbi:MAG: 4Fe-4S dicluster domain-containing protein [Thermoplasmata archaeon]|nr:4Fe-4S dicluster domain-containing protein [Thermoplasmata archaeon]
MQLYVDPMTCTGCRICQLVCSFNKEHKIWPASARVEVIREKSGRDCINACRNCKNPKCMAACKSGAISIVDGKVLIDERKCTGGGECIPACPFGAIKLHPLKKKAIKCDFCGKCVEFCPPRVLKMR